MRHICYGGLLDNWCESSKAQYVSLKTNIYVGFIDNDGLNLIHLHISCTMSDNLVIKLSLDAKRIDHPKRSTNRPVNIYIYEFSIIIDIMPTQMRFLWLLWEIYGICFSLRYTYYQPHLLGRRMQMMCAGDRAVNFEWGFLLIDLHCS